MTKIIMVTALDKPWVTVLVSSLTIFPAVAQHKTLCDRKEYFSGITRAKLNSMPMSSNLGSRNLQSKPDLLIRSIFPWWKQKLNIPGPRAAKIGQVISAKLNLFRQDLRRFRNPRPSPSRSNGRRVMSLWWQAMASTLRRLSALSMSAFLCARALT